MTLLFIFDDKEFYLIFKYKWVAGEDACKGCNDELPPDLSGGFKGSFKIEPICQMRLCRHLKI